MFDHSKRVAQLKTEIDTFRLKRTKDNQRLAKDIARWVDDVMTGKAKREKDADIAVADDFDENDGSSAATAKCKEFCSLLLLRVFGNCCTFIDDILFVSR